MYSLVPSHSLHPVVDRLQYVKTEWEGLVYFITCTWMTSVSTEEGGIPDRKNEVEAFSCTLYIVVSVSST